MFQTMSRLSGIICSPREGDWKRTERLVQKYCEKVGIDAEVSVHSLRVTAATEADKAGIPLINIQHWLGHKDPRTTLRYIRGTVNLGRSPAYTIRYG